MGSHQSAIIKKKLSASPPGQRDRDFAIKQQKSSPSSLQSDSATRSLSMQQSRNSQTETLKNVELKVGHINTLVAKTWNPNDPKSWEPEMREYHELQNSDYMLPNDAAEQDRLEMQHYIFRAAFQGDIVCPSVRKLIAKSALKILDVGCANGFWLEHVKKSNSLAECHGVDISTALFDQSTENNGISLKFGNILEILPYEDNTFDFVHERLLVLGIPREKFPDVIKELIRVTKPGGWIELVEMDIVIYNAGPYSQTLTTALFDGLHERGLDSYGATNLLFYVKEATDNVENQEERVLHLSIGGNSKMGILFGADWKAGILGVEDWMHKAMGISRDEYRQLCQGCYLEWGEHKSFAQVRALYFRVKKQNNGSHQSKSQKNLSANPSVHAYSDSVVTHVMLPSDVEEQDRLEMQHYIYLTVSR
ncbi:hypothetical protein HK100_007801, partial [Physocladia obscura]